MPKRSDSACLLPAICTALRSTRLCAFNTWTCHALWYQIPQLLLVRTQTRPAPVSRSAASTSFITCAGYRLRLMKTCPGTGAYGGCRLQSAPNAMSKCMTRLAAVGAAKSDSRAPLQTVPILATLHLQLDLHPTSSRCRCQLTSLSKQAVQTIQVPQCGFR